MGDNTINLGPLPFITEPERKTPLQQAMSDIADVMVYPVDARGRVYDLRYLIPVLSYHLARAGCVVDPSRAVIKKRPVPPTPGVMEGVVEWVPIWAADTIDEELADTTLADADKLSPFARAEWIRRLGGNPDTAMKHTPDADLSEKVPWRVETNIHFDDESAADG